MSSQGVLTELAALGNMQLAACALFCWRAATGESSLDTKIDLGNHQCIILSESACTRYE
jgi:hypothetical protein